MGSTLLPFRGFHALTCFFVLSFWTIIAILEIRYIFFHFFASVETFSGSLYCFCTLFRVRL